MLGNEAETNAAGFVDLCKDTVAQDFAHFSLFTRIEDPFKFGTVTRKLKAVSNCWICEGWS